MSTLPPAWSSIGLVERFRKLYDLAQQGSPERLEVVEWLASVRADRITAENQRRSTLVYEELYVRQHNMKTDESVLTITATVTLTKQTGSGAYFLTNHFEDIIANNTINAESIVSANPNPATAIAIYEWFLKLVQVVDADPAGDGTLPASHVASWIMPVVAPAVGGHPTGTDQHEFTLSVDVPGTMKPAIVADMVANKDDLLNEILVGTQLVSAVYDPTPGAITVTVA
jgi:hypothetical protein